MKKTPLAGLRFSRPTVRNLRTGPCRAKDDHLIPANDPVLYARSVEHYTRLPLWLRIVRAVKEWLK